MCNISYARHRFPPNVIQQAVWLYLRFALNYRDVEDLLAERGLDVSYETVRRWVIKFGVLYAEGLTDMRIRQDLDAVHHHFVLANFLNCFCATSDRRSEPR